MSRFFHVNSADNVDDANALTISPTPLFFPPEDSRAEIEIKKRVEYKSWSKCIYDCRGGLVVRSSAS